MHQAGMVCLNDLVPAAHSYRRCSELWTFEFTNQQLKYHGVMNHVMIDN